MHCVCLRGVPECFHSIAVKTYIDKLDSVQNMKQGRLSKSKRNFSREGKGGCKKPRLYDLSPVKVDDQLENKREKPSNQLHVKNLQKSLEIDSLPTETIGMK